MLMYMSCLVCLDHIPQQPLGESLVYLYVTQRCTPTISCPQRNRMAIPRMVRAKYHCGIEYPIIGKLFIGMGCHWPRVVVARVGDDDSHNLSPPFTVYPGDSPRSKFMFVAPFNLFLQIPGSASIKRTGDSGSSYFHETPPKTSLPFRLSFRSSPGLFLGS